MPPTPPGTTKLPLQTPGQLLAAALNSLGNSFKASPPPGNPNALPGPAAPQLPGTAGGGLTSEQVAETQALMRSGASAPTSNLATLTDTQRLNQAPTGQSRPPSAILGQRDFGPLQPLTPRYTEGSPEATLGPRKFQYPVGVNILVTPRGEYPDLVPFYQLHNLALAYDVSAMCILTRIEEIQGMGHSVVANDKRRQAELQDVCDEVEAFFKKPDGVQTLDAWLAALVREHLTTDALTVFPRRQRDGNLYAAELVSGDTIKPLLDDQGRIQAYQQVLYGYPFTEYTRTKNDESAHPSGPGNPSDFPTWSTQELMYLPRYTSTRHPYGNPPAETIVMRVNQALRKQVFDLAYFCYDRETEILTRQGWVKFPDLPRGIEVATRSADGRFEWQEPTDYNDQPYDGELLEFKNKVVDLLVTPNHRMLVRRKWEGGWKNSQPGRWHIERADAFLDGGKHFARYHEMPATSGWEGDAPAVKHLVAPTPRKTGRASGDIDMPMMAWVELAGLFLAEGSVSKHHSYDMVEIAQSPNSRHLPEIERILEATGLPWNHNGWKYTSHNRALANELRCFGQGAENKHMTEEIKDIPPDLLGRLVHGMMIGDGHVTSDGMQRYTTTSKALAGDLQEVVQKMGGNASVLEQAPLAGRYIGAWGRKTQYLVELKRAETHTVPMPKAVPYQGTIHCVTVPNGIVYVRRNGRAIWSGNTAGNIPDMLATMPQGIFTPDEIKQFEEAFNGLLEGDDEARRKIRFIPYQADVKELRPFTYETVLDEWMLRITCAAYAVPPQELGFTEDINRATAELQEAVNERRGLKPTSSWIKNAILDELIHNGFGNNIGQQGGMISLPGTPTRPPTNPYKLVGWSWLYGDKADANQVSQTDDIYMKAQVISPDEVRAMRFGTELEGPSPATLALQAQQMATQTAAQASGKFPIDIQPVPGAENTPPVGQEPQSHDAEAMAIPIEPVKAAAAGWTISKSVRLPAWERDSVETFLIEQMGALLDYHQRRIGKGRAGQSVFAEMVGDLAGVLSRDVVANLTASAHASAPTAFWRSVGLVPSLQAAQAIMLTKQADAVQFCLQPYFQTLEMLGKGQVDRADLETTGRASLVNLASVWCTLLENVPIIAAFSRVAKSGGGEGHLVVQPPKHINCFPADTLVDVASGIEKAYRRWYEGPLVKIKTAGGRQLAGTPNHPVLTSRGWVALGLLQKGDKVFSRLVSKQVPMGGDLDLGNKPTGIGEIFSTLQKFRKAEQTPGAVVDFHGDGREADVDVINVDGLLRDRLTAEFNKPVNQGAFPLSYGASSTTLLDGQGVGDFAVGRDGAVAHSIMGGTRPLAPLLGAGAGHAHDHAFVGATQRNSSIGQPAIDSLAGDALFDSQLLGRDAGLVTLDDPLQGVAVDRFVPLRAQAGNAGPVGYRDTRLGDPVANGLSADPVVLGEDVLAFPGDVTLDEIVEISVTDFAGHVYNLQTGDGTYMANGIIAHNCRCRLRVRLVKMTDATHAPRSQVDQPDDGRAHDEEEAQAPSHSDQQQQAQADTTRRQSWGDKGRQAAAANQQSHFAPLIPHDEPDEADPEREGVYFAVRDWLRKDWASEASDAADSDPDRARQDAEEYRRTHSPQAPAPAPAPAPDDGVWVAVWHAADERACTTLYKTPWGGLTRGCLGLNDICVSSGPLLGHMIPA